MLIVGMLSITNWFNNIKAEDPDPSIDRDMDGIIDSVEYEIGTNPYDPQFKDIGEGIPGPLSYFHTENNWDIYYSITSDDGLSVTGFYIIPNLTEPLLTKEYKVFSASVPWLRFGGQIYELKDDDLYSNPRITSQGNFFSLIATYNHIWHQNVAIDVHYEFYNTGTAYYAVKVTFPTGDSTTVDVCVKINNDIEEIVPWPVPLSTPESFDVYEQSYPPIIKYWDDKSYEITVPCASPFYLLSLTDPTKIRAYDSNAMKQIFFGPTSNPSNQQADSEDYYIIKVGNSDENYPWNNENGEEIYHILHYIGDPKLAPMGMFYYYGTKSMNGGGSTKDDMFDGNIFFRDFSQGTSIFSPLTGLDDIIKWPEIEVDPAIFELLVRNNLPEVETFNLEIDNVPEGWDAVLSLDSVELITAGQIPIELYVTPPANAEPDVPVPITVTATALNNPENTNSITLTTVPIII